jgi:hypothetical protein
MPPARSPVFLDADPGVNELIEPENDQDAGQQYVVRDEWHHPGVDLYRETGDFAALNDASFLDWYWLLYRVRNQDEMTREHTKHTRVFVTKMVGPLDILQVQQVCGGGVIEIRGHFAKKLRLRFEIDLAGPRIDYSKPAPAPVGSMAVPVAVPDGPSRTERILLRMVRENKAALDLLAQKVATPAAVAPQAVTDFRTVVDMADMLSKRANPSPEASTIATMLGMFEKGLGMASKMEGQPERSQTEIIIEKAAPMVERLLGAMLTARRQAPPRPGPAPRPAGPPPPPAPQAVHSEATVIENPATPDMDSIRMMTAVDSLARAVTESRTPDDFAASLEDILSADQLAVIRLSPADEVVRTVIEGAAGQYPVLETPGAKAYLAAVLTALKDESVEDVEIG